MDDALLLMEDPKKMLSSLEDAEVRMQIERADGAPLSAYLAGNMDWD